MPWKDDGRLTDEFRSCEKVIWAATSLNPILAETRSDLVEEELFNWARMLNSLSPECEIHSFIFLSSGGCVYTGKDGPFREEMEATGINKYGAMKAMQEELLLEALPQSTVVRFSNLYGTGQPHGRGQGVIAEWAYALDAQIPLKIYGDLKASRDYLHKKDAVRAVQSLLDAHSPGVFNVGSGISTSLEEILELFKTFSPSSFLVDQKPGRDFDRKHYKLAIGKFKNRTGWAPSVTLAEGISEILGQKACE